MNFFLTLNKNGNVSFSPFRERDKLNTSVISYLSTPLSLANIQVVQERLQRRDLFAFWHKVPKQKDTQLEILKIIKELGWDAQDFTWKEVCPILKISQNPVDETRDHEVWTTFNRLILGRQLSYGDLRGFARELKIKDEEITKLAHTSVEQGFAEWVPAVRPHGSGWQCQRCGEKDVEEWPSLYGMAATCRSCESIGSSTSLDVLYRDQRSLLDGPTEVRFQPHWVLTEAQRLAGQQVFEFIKDASEDTALLWAACGAGKTEVCFPSAAWALEQGKSVLFAAPRQDVINDVVPRLRRDFPDYPLQVLTGTSLVKFQSGGMVLATTHQVSRFWRAFDVVFMDEMDAFPYHGSRALEWGLKHALRQNGKILYLTATPSPEGLKGVQQGKIRLIRLPARHHRTALPVPIWERSRHSLEPNGCIGLWTTQIERLRVLGPVLVFVPKISWVDPWTKCLQRCFPDWSVEGSYSSDPGRSMKIKRLRQCKYDLFVSTTILERGITLSGIQVVVLAADHPVFDERALVQMAGRVGRTRESPAGNVLFVSKRMTSAMKTAVRWIEEQNKLALELGLIET
ncbi:Type III restriction enzyme, res subunit [Candidatus Desulfosporosinus infrequens]|uniref:Type III restriction enzyme, res subunit n=1 Tax=Candidatus Desulfosporosinus infrequens TaxID=2043169 RepID=A0A2U3LVK2_9FIRM|nr:Type III restriction enzyme, res subunit [Candidatus Desulfosporosinus infrequens]